MRSGCNSQWSRQWFIPEIFWSTFWKCLFLSIGCQESIETGCVPDLTISGKCLSLAELIQSPTVTNLLCRCRPSLKYWIKLIGWCGASFVFTCLERLMLNKKVPIWWTVSKILCLESTTNKIHRDIHKVVETRKNGRLEFVMCLMYLATLQESSVIPDLVNLYQHSLLA